MRVMKYNDIATVRRAIAELARTKYVRRYPPALRARLAALAGAHPEQSVASLAKALDMAPQTLERIVAEGRAPVLPVRVVSEQSKVSTIVVRGPHGIVVEGLDVNELAELIRRLS